MFHFILGPWLTYVQGRVDLAPVTKLEYARVARLLLAGPEVEVHDGAVDLGPFVVARMDARAAPRTIALEIRIATAAVRWAQRAGLLGAGLVLRRPKVRIDRHQHTLNHRTPSVDDAASVIAAMPRDDRRLAVLLLARTGARVGEVVQLRRVDLDERAGVLTLGRVEGASKTGLRRFPLDPTTLAELRCRPSNGACWRPAMRQASTVSRRTDCAGWSSRGCSARAWMPARPPR